MPSLQVLVIDDEAAARQVLAAAVRRAGHSVDTAADVAQAREKLSHGDFDVALCDIQLPDGLGIDLLKESRTSGLDTAFVMVTAFASLETAVEALRSGAYDYIIKPVRNEEVLNRLSQIETLRGLREENRALRRQVGESMLVYRFSSPAMLEVERLVGKVGPTDGTVLITGESGTGKGVLARAIHEKSKRRERPFLSVNCSAIPDQLMESEFFGHVRGAFTGADRARKGLFAAADGGTLFLDEISELPLPMQTKLLNVIEDKEVRPVGSEQVRRIDVRIIAATNRNLPDAVADGTFREDLFFRLGMFAIGVPPLRERQADIRGLIRFFLGGNRVQQRLAAAAEIEPEAEELLLAYSWPGNVRELENVIARARILAESACITVADLPPEVTRLGPAHPNGAKADGREEYLRERVRKFEAAVIQGAVDGAGGDRRLAAQRLGISLSSLYRKLDELVASG
jgi:two-component system, NtrC family, response regulator AtoC